MLFCYILFLWKPPVLLFNNPGQWMISQFNMYVCIYKANGMTSTCKQNKSHTTHLTIPSISSVCKNIYNQHKIMISIVNIYVYMHMYIILIILIILY